MKIIAILLMLIGFFWSAALLISPGYSHALWVWHSQQLGQDAKGEMIPIKDASKYMRNLQLSIKDSNRPILLPVFVLLIGGLLNGARTKSNAEQAVADQSATAPQLKSE